MEMEDKVIALFSIAINDLKDANEELCRPEEEIVPHVVCKYSQSAIDNFLKGFLTLNGIDTSPYKTTDSLFEQCAILNKGINSVTTKSFVCGLNAINSHRCNEVTKKSYCHETADRLESFLKNEGILK